MNREVFKSLVKYELSGTDYGLTEEEMIELGNRIVSVFRLNPVKNRERIVYDTEFGTKAPLGVARTFLTLFEEILTK